MNKTKINQTPETMEQFLAKIDFKELKSHKHAIIRIQDKSEKKKINLTQKEWEALEGMLNLIDAFQDVAVDHYGYKERQVFKLSRKEI